MTYGRILGRRGERPGCREEGDFRAFDVEEELD